MFAFIFFRIKNKTEDENYEKILKSINVYPINELSIVDINNKNKIYNITNNNNKYLEYNNDDENNTYFDLFGFHFRSLKSVTSIYFINIL